jgi:hypothetical protein
MDLIAWDLGDPGGEMQTGVTVLPPLNFTFTNKFHPMKGPMTTQTLRGLNGLDPLHWRGDRTNFTHFNIAFPGLMGSTALSTNDMIAYRDFVNSIVFEPNPNQNLDRTYPTNFAGGDPSAGRNAFFFTNYTSGLSCNSCHSGPPGPGSNKLIIPAAALDESQDFKVPQLRSIYQKMNFNNNPGAVSIGGFGIVHDGIDPTLQVFLSRPVFTNIRNDTTIKNNIAAFVQCFDTGTAPAVGYTRTVLATNVTNSLLSNDWSLLENQALAANIDLIVKGTIDGQIHGLLYQPVPNNYQPDSTNLPAFTRAQLVTRIQNGDRLSLMGVPPGSGIRMGIDRNSDGVLDGDVPAPSLHIVQATAGAVISWPYSAAGFSLETTPSLAGPNWTNTLDPLEIVGGQNVVTNPPSNNAKFFRLRRPTP